MNLVKFLLMLLSVFLVAGSLVSCSQAENKQTEGKDYYKQALRYFDGEEVPRDFKKGTDLLLKALESGDFSKSYGELFHIVHIEKVGEAIVALCETNPTARAFVANGLYRKGGKELATAVLRELVNQNNRVAMGYLGVTLILLKATGPPKASKTPFGWNIPVKKPDTFEEGKELLQRALALGNTQAGSILFSIVKGDWKIPKETRTKYSKAQHSYYDEILYPTTSMKYAFNTKGEVVEERVSGQSPTTTENLPQWPEIAN